MKRRIDPQLWAAARMIENLAGKIDEVRTHVRQELTYADSFPDHTPGAADPTSGPTTPLEGVCVTRVPIDAELDVWRTCGRYRPCGEHDTPVTLTPVERAAEARLRLNRDLSDFEAQCRLIVIAASDAIGAADRMIGARLEHAKLTECRDGQVGREGAHVWGDVTCEKTALKVGLCNTHYMAARRWREREGLDTSKMVEPAREVA